MNKGYRQRKILKLIQARNLRTQSDLVGALQEMGITATQVTVSRDIHDLGLIKTKRGYARSKESAAAQTSLAAADLKVVAREFLKDVRVAQNLVVLQTPPGHANAVAAALDEAEWPGVVGTLAGDDTVLVVAATALIAGSLRRRLLGLL
jgi:transcriptional regulator of arginine metabolism